MRKVRSAGRGKGKSGGYRVITFVTGPTLPVLLITGHGKGAPANPSEAERNAPASRTKAPVEACRRRVVPIRG